MKWIWSFLILMLAFSMATAGPGPSNSKTTGLRIDAYEGKLFTGPDDRDYKEYDLVLKNRMIRRIQQKFGVELSHGSYSGYDLLEIESLIRLKKPQEPLDPFLKMFPKSR
jgi:hypothetical protein